VKITARYIAILLGLVIFSSGFFYLLNLSNRRAVEARTLELAVSEGKTIEKVLGKAALHLLEKGEGHLLRFMDEIYVNDQVIYVAVRRSGRLLHARSKYEGYLPLENDLQPVKTFASPLGEIIEVTTAMNDRSGLQYTAHIGYFFSAIGEIRNSARKSFLLLTLLQAAIVLVLVAFLSSFNRQMGRKEIEIQREKEEKEKLQEISLITSGINHEIKNPLNSLYLSYQMLEPRLDPADPETAFHSQTLKREIKRILDIIDRFSSLSHSIATHMEAIDLRRFFAELQAAWSGPEASPRIILRLETQKEPVSDRGLLRQVMDNMIRNAMEAGATLVTITVRGAKKKTFFSIRDDGRGISKEHIKFIFDPFISFKSRGSGIGLALARKIIMQLGGRIEVESVEGRGAEFKIVL